MNLPTASEKAPALAAATASSPRFFYGWVVVACAFTILCIAYGIQFTFGVFMPFISADTDGIAAASRCRIRCTYSSIAPWA